MSISSFHSSDASARCTYILRAVTTTISINTSSLSGTVLITQLVTIDSIQSKAYMYIREGTTASYENKHWKNEIVDLYHSS